MLPFGSHQAPLYRGSPRFAACFHSRVTRVLNIHVSCFSKQSKSSSATSACPCFAARKSGVAPSWLQGLGFRFVRCGVQGLQQGAM
ncbi:hypothetical protein T484DRAFT_2462538 [Baffinella frigidus]|nr:hypothetical protein T484DRAFT_2462538 [Cryptophyta sp. CCMP2293]